MSVLLILMDYHCAKYMQNRLTGYLRFPKSNFMSVNSYLLAL